MRDTGAVPYTRMSDDQVRAFLSSEPARPAVLSGVRKDGRAHAAPVWYALDGDQVCFNTAVDTVKGRILRRTRYAVLTVQDDRPPFSYLTVEGPVELVDDLDEVRRWATTIGGRYMGADRAEELGARNGVPGELVVRVTIAKAYGVLDVAD